MVKRITVNVDDDLHYNLKLNAAKNQTTITEIILEFLENYLKDQSK